MINTGVTTYKTARQGLLFAPQGAPKPLRSDCLVSTITPLKVNMWPNSSLPIIYMSSGTNGPTNGMTAASRGTNGTPPAGGGGDDYDRQVSNAWRRLRKILTVINPNITERSLRTIKAAFDMAVQAHKGQLRRSGEPYFLHPYRVAYNIVRYFRYTDETTIIAALLHDVIEDTLVTEQEIFLKFGQDVLDLVDSVTKLNRWFYMELSTKKLREKNLEKLFFAITQDVRIALLKLADRLDNMETLEHLEEKRQQEIAHETFELYVPLAEILGLWDIKEPLEDLSFKFIRKKGDHEQLSALRSERKEKTARLARKLKEELLEALNNGGIKDARIDIKWRTNYNAIVEQKRVQEMGPLFDIEHLVVVVPQKELCSKAMEIIHKNFEFKWDRIRDYINDPWRTFFESLGTDLIWGNGNPRIFIRDGRMDAIAKRGIVAKLFEYGEDLGDEWRKMTKDFERQIVASQNLYADLRSGMDQIFVYTKLGDRMYVPKGWKAHDLAFWIHSKLGIEATAAVVDGVPVPLSSVLRSGSVVEILRKVGHKPKRKDFEDSVTLVREDNDSPPVNVKAREAINRYFAKRGLDVNISEGREELVKIFMEDLFIDYNDERIQRILKSRFLRRIDTMMQGSLVDLRDLEYSVGIGMISSKKVAEEFGLHIKKLWRRSKEFEVSLSMNVENKAGMLAVITDPFRQLGINITAIEMTSQENKKDFLSFTVKSGIQVMQVLNSLKTIKGIEELAVKENFPAQPLKAPKDQQENGSKQVLLTRFREAGKAFNLINHIYYGIKGGDIYLKEGNEYGDFVTFASQGPLVANLQAEKFYDHLKKLGNKLPQVLYVHEWGGGDGRFAIDFLEKIKLLDKENGTDFYSRIKYVLCDVSKSMLAAAEEKILAAGHGESAKFHAVDAERIPIKQDGPFKAEGASLIRFNELWDDLTTSYYVKKGGKYYQVYLRLKISENSVKARDGTKVDALEFAQAFRQKNVMWLSELNPEFLFFIDYDVKLVEVKFGKVPYGNIIREHIDSFDEGKHVPVNVGAIGNLEKAKELLSEDGYIESIDYGFLLMDLNSGRQRLCDDFEDNYVYGGSRTHAVNFVLMQKIAKEMGLIMDVESFERYLLLLRGEQTRMIETFGQALSQELTGVRGVLRKYLNEGKLPLILPKSKLVDVQRLLEDEGYSVQLETLEKIFSGALSQDKHFVIRHAPAK